MSSFIIIVTLSILLGLAVVVGILFAAQKQRMRRRIAVMNKELLDASQDASVGRRLTVPSDPESAQLANTVNRIFDALGERDEQIHGRDRLFKEFARTLPEIVIIHDEKIMLANEQAAGLVGLEPTQLIGREIADLVKPAYRALFRKNVQKRLARESVPGRLEIQLISATEEQ